MTGGRKAKPSENAPGRMFNKMQGNVQGSAVRVASGVCTCCETGHTYISLFHTGSGCSYVSHTHEE